MRLKIGFCRNPKLSDLASQKVIFISGVLEGDIYLLPRWIIVYLALVSTIAIWLIFQPFPVYSLFYGGWGLNVFAGTIVVWSLMFASMFSASMISRWPIYNKFQARWLTGSLGGLLACVLIISGITFTWSIAYLILYRNPYFLLAAPFNILINGFILAIEFYLVPLMFWISTCLIYDLIIKKKLTNN